MLLRLLLGLSCACAALAADCKLTEVPSSKPEPSLTMCYKFNTDACCVSAHDSIIKDSYASMLSAACIDEYPFLQLFMCVGCHPDQGQYVDEATQTVRICPDLEAELWNEDPKMYDACGLVIDGLTGVEVLVPSAELTSATDLMNRLSVPFFDGYTFVVDDSQPCMSSPAVQAAPSLAVVLLASLLPLALTSFAG